MVSRLLPQSLAVLVLVLAPVGLPLGLLLGWAAPARAADGDTTIAVLGIEAVDGQDNGVANEMTEALRQRFALAKGTQLVQGKDLVEIKLVFSCSDDAVDCLSQAAKSLGATKLIYGNVKRSGGDYVLTLKLLDAARGVLEGSTVETIPRRKSEPGALRALSSQWVSKLAGKAGAGAGAGSLIIRSNVVGVVVTIDGAEAGVTSRKALTIPDVAPGKHEIKAEKPGYATSRQQFTLGGAQALPLTLTMRSEGGDGQEGEHDPEAALEHRSPGGDEVPPADAGHTWARAGFWVGMGLGALSFAVAAKYGLDVRSINSDLDLYRNVPLTDVDKRTFVHDKLAEGSRAETRQWIFVGVGAAFTVAGGVLLYKGYLDKESGSGPKTSDNHGLRVFPTANTSSGGIAAEFDF